MIDKHRKNAALSSRLSLTILLGFLSITIVGFGGLLGVLYLSDADRSTSLIAIAFALPAISIVLLTFIKKMVYSHGYGWGDIGFSRPSRRLFHLLWQIPAILTVLIAVQAVFLGLLNLQSSAQPNGIDTIISEVPIYAMLAFS